MQVPAGKTSVKLFDCRDLDIFTVRAPAYMKIKSRMFDWRNKLNLVSTITTAVFFRPTVVINMIPGQPRIEEHRSYGGGYVTVVASRR